MKVNNYPLKTPAAGDKLFGSDSNGDQKQFDMSNFGTSTYKVYTALLTQTGTDAPVATVLENTIGNITFKYEIPGQYKAFLSGAFPQLKTFVYIQQITPDEGSITTYYSDINSIQITTLDDVYAEVNDKLYNTSIEIRVYN